MNTKDRTVSSHASSRSRTARVGVPMLVVEELTLFPGTLVPLHAFEPTACKTLTQALADDRLIVLASQAAGGAGREAPAIAGLGRIVSDRRYPDGRLDVFIHGLERVALTAMTQVDGGWSADVRPIPDDGVSITAWPGSRDEAESGARMLGVSLSLLRALKRAGRLDEAECLGALLASSSDLPLVSNRVAAALVSAFVERQALLEEARVEARLDRLAAVLGELRLEINSPNTAKAV